VELFLHVLVVGASQMIRESFSFVLRGLIVFVECVTSYGISTWTLGSNTNYLPPCIRHLPV
jgi:hypothetical protein